MEKFLQSSPLHFNLLCLSRSDMDTCAGSSLFSFGWQQIDNLCKHVHECGLAKTIDLVIVSPLLRTLQTAVGVFGGEGYTDRMDMVPLMVANTGNSGRAAISSLNCPPIVAGELFQDHLGVRPCDKRRDISDYQFYFPTIDFSLIRSGEDTWWKTVIRETKEKVVAWGLKFLNWVGQEGKVVSIGKMREMMKGYFSSLVLYCDKSWTHEFAQEVSNTKPVTKQDESRGWFKVFLVLFLVCTTGARGVRSEDIGNPLFPGSTAMDFLLANKSLRGLGERRQMIGTEVAAVNDNFNYPSFPRGNSPPNSPARNQANPYKRPCNPGDKCRQGKIGKKN